MQNYSKPPLLVNDQVNLLKKRGMLINDEEKVKNFLLFNNYYKFAGYWKKFAETKSHIIKDPNHSFEFFETLYLNDKELSHIILKYISIMEDALRTQYAYYLAINTSSSHPHLNKNNFIQKKYDDLYKKLLASFERSSHQFKEHYKQTYIETLPPIWVLVEILSLGDLINLITKTKSNIIINLYDQFNYKRQLLKSFFYSLYFVRNQCAHNSILWNIDYQFLPEIPINNKNNILNKINSERPKIILNFLLILIYLLEEIKLEVNIRNDLQFFFNSIEEKYLEGYGIDLKNKNIFLDN